MRASTTPSLDLNRYASWHVIRGSSPDVTDDKFGDLPGELSIMAMMRRDIEFLHAENILRS